LHVHDQVEIEKQFTCLPIKTEDMKKKKLNDEKNCTKMLPVIYFDYITFFKIIRQNS